MSILPCRCSLSAFSSSLPFMRLLGACRMQRVQTELVCAATIGVAATALTEHTREALR